MGLLNNLNNPVFLAFRHPTRVVSIFKLVLLWRKTYFGAQKKANPDHATIIETKIDDRIAPVESAIYPYLFACLYVMYIAWHILEKMSHEESKKAHDTYVRLIHESEYIFLTQPTRMRDRARIEHPLTRFTQTIDGPTNCFPSMHVALVVLSYEIIRNSPKVDSLLLSAMKKSGLDICRATMQTKQHSMIDVIGGYTLAQKIYRETFHKSTENFLAEILPELTSSEMLSTQKLIDETSELPALMHKLIAEFSRDTV